MTYKVPKTYVPNSLSKKDKNKQKRSLKKSRKLYKKKEYFIRPKVKSFKSKVSPHIVRARKLYKIDSIKPSRKLAKKTKCSIKGLRKIVKKGQGAYYSSGSRPSQTPHSWGIARLASAISGGKSSRVDAKILREHCKPSSKAIKLIYKKDIKVRNKVSLKGGKKKSKKKKKMNKPRRHEDGHLVFTDYPDFKPNLTPKEILNLGSFGGTYFRDIKSSVTKKNYTNAFDEFKKHNWLSEDKIKTHATNDKCNTQLNFYKRRAGLSLKHWEDSGWMREIDPYGWFQWYCRFYLGRRCYDDERQVDRWVKYAGEKSGRWRRRLIGMCIDKNKKFDDASVSPVIRQGLQQWAYKLTKKDYDKFKESL